MKPGGTAKNKNHFFVPTGTTILRRAPVQMRVLTRRTVWWLGENVAPVQSSNNRTDILRTFDQRWELRTPLRFSLFSHLVVERSLFDRDMRPFQPSVYALSSDTLVCRKFHNDARLFDTKYATVQCVPD